MVCYRSMEEQHTRLENFINLRHFFIIQLLYFNCINPNGHTLSIVVIIVEGNVAHWQIGPKSVTNKWQNNKCFKKEDKKFTSLHYISVFTLDTEDGKKQETKDKKNIWDGGQNLTPKWTNGPSEREWTKLCPVAFPFSKWT